MCMVYHNYGVCVSFITIMVYVCMCMVYHNYGVSFITIMYMCVCVWFITIMACA